jgi:hypothetical protein
MSWGAWIPAKRSLTLSCVLLTEESTFSQHVYCQTSVFLSAREVDICLLNRALASSPPKNGLSQSRSTVAELKELS